MSLATEPFSASFQSLAKPLRFAARLIDDGTSIHDIYQAPRHVATESARGKPDTDDGSLAKTCGDIQHVWYGALHESRKQARLPPVRLDSSQGLKRSQLIGHGIPFASYSIRSRPCLSLNDCGVS
jgi:hypothetical protein